MEMATFLVPFGVGGALAAFIFYFYRKDLMNDLGLAKEDREILLKTMTRNTEAITEFREAVRRNTETLDDMKSFCRFRDGGISTLRTPERSAP